MTEHHDPSTDHDSPVSSGTIALAQRFVISSLEHSGNPKLKRLGRVIKKFPEMAGQKVGPILGKIFGSVEKGEPIKTEDKEKLLKIMEQHPQEATAILGLLTADLLAGGGDAASERQALLEYYRSSLTLVCTAMASRTTSVALRGFIHDGSCVSYWHFERKNLQFSMSSSSEVLFPNGLDVYFLELEPTDESLTTLNRLIRDNPERHLDKALYDINCNESISQLDSIYETKLTFRKLDKDRAKTANAEPDPLRLRLASDPDSPIKFESRIPPEPDALVAMLESLNVALAAQDHRLDEVKEGQRRLAEKLLPGK